MRSGKWNQIIMEPVRVKSLTAGRSSDKHTPANIQNQNSKRNKRTRSHQRHRTRREYKRVLAGHVGERYDESHSNQVRIADVPPNPKVIEPMGNLPLLEENTKLN